MMQIVPKFTYEKLQRDESSGKRLYCTPQGHNVASVTTILDATKSAEAKAALQAWRRSIGEKAAQQISTESATRGTIMHSYLEKTLLGEDPPRGTNFYHKQAWDMAQVIIKNYLLPNLTEVWGLEASLYYPELYAGTTDLCGVYAGRPSIMDFKQSNRIKSDDRVVDYKIQMCAYMMAHNAVYGTDIDQGVILMCTPALEPQTWVLEGAELEHYKQIWWQRVAQYYQV